MGTQITFRRGSSFPTAGSGITLSEPVFETTLHTFHIGLGYGVTAEWVGAPISGLSADIGAGITYKIPTAASVLNYISGLCYGNTGAVTITQYVSSFNGSTGAVQGVSSFNGLTGAVGGVCASQANTFTALQSFGNGISASGITVNGNMSVTGNFTVSGGVTFTTSETVLIEDNIITLNSNVTGSPSENAGIEIERGTSANVQLLWNESSDRWTFTNDGSTYYDLPTSVVTSFNGNTGAVQGVSSVNGSTGAITNVARTNVDNNFTEYQTIKSFGSGVPVLLLRDPSGYTMSFVPDTSFGTPNISVDSGSASQILQFSATASTNTVTLPNFTTTLAGLTGTQTFTGLKTFTGGLCASAGITFNGTVSGATATFSRLTTHTAGLCAAGITVSGDIRFSGTSAKTISSNQATLTIAGISTSSVLVGSNSVVMGVQVTDSLTLNSATSVVDISTTTSGVYPSIPSIRILTDDADTIGAGSIKIIPASYATANRTQYLQDADGTFALTSQLMGAVNGSTAATTAVTSFNGRTGAVQGVSSAAAGTGISVNAATGAITITNIGVQSFNGNTGAVTGASLGANTFTGLNTFNAGVTTSFLYASTGSTFGSTLQVNGGATFAGRVDVGGILDVVGGTTFESTTDHAGVARFASGVTISGTLNGATATFSRWLSAPIGISAQIITSRGNSLVLSGLTSGAVGSGSQIILPVADGIQLNGYGGAVALGSVQAGSVSYNTSLKFTSEDTLNEIYGSVTLTPPSYTNGDYTLYLPNTANGTLALTSQLMGAVNGSTAATTAVTSFNGNTGAVTGASLGANTFTGLNTFNAGVTTSSLYVSGGATFGATAEFSRSVVLQNSEFIRNSTNGRIDFMPAPSGTTHYGLYVDCTTWGYGPQIGTIRSSDNALDTTGILFSGQLTMGNNTRLNLGSNGQNGIVCANQGNDTIQIFTDVTTGTNSGAVAIIDSAGQNLANRSPTTVHANPNLYIYRAGSASANDFIRIEHDGTNANIVTGGSSAIDMEPGSGFVGFSGGISASGGITFSSTMRVAGTATFAGLINSTAGLSGTGITLSGNLSAATKSFVIPHPTQPHMTLQHGSLEGPENGVYVRGRLTGTDTIPIPHYWHGLVDSSTITVTLTEIGNRNHHWVAAVDGYTITVASEGGGIDCFYTVWGERKDVGKLPVEY